jgi:hypothetical protein
MILAAFLTPLLASAFPSQANAANVDLSIRIGDRYQGDRLAFRERPRMVVVPNTRVYYVQDSSDRDVYQYGRFYYANEGGRWYRARNYRGPWIYVRARSVPRQIYAVPADYRRGGWRGDYNYWQNRDYDRDWNSGDRPNRGDRTDRNDPRNGSDRSGNNNDRRDRGNGRGN